MEEDDDVSALIFRTKNQLQLLMFSLMSKLAMFRATPAKDLHKVLSEIEKSMGTSTEAMLHCERSVEGLEHLIHSSATRIQKVLRGKWGRRRYHTLNQPRAERKFRMQSAAAVKIQCMARKRMARKRIEFKKLMLAIKAEVQRRNSDVSQPRRLRNLKRELDETFSDNELEKMSKSIESIDNDALDEELKMLDEELSSSEVAQGGAWSLFYIDGVNNMAY